MIATLKFHLACDNRQTYRVIAREFGTSALHVYRLAHGRRGRNDRDYYIIKRLKEKGVLISTFF